MKKYLLVVMTYMILISSFCTVVKASSQSETELISVSDTYELTSLVRDISENRPVFYTEEDTDFPSERLIVFSETEFDFRNAQLAITDSDGLFVLFFASRTEAEKAFDVYAADPCIDAIPDVEISIPDPAQTDTAATAEDDVNISSTHMSWGAAFTGTDGFSDMLTAKYGSAAQMPQVTVAVIDTGVDYDHPRLSGRIINGYDYVNSDSDPMDDHGHGTHVSGIICDNTTANVQILAYKTVSSSGKGSLINTVSAVKDAQKKGVDVINLSLGVTDTSGSGYRSYFSDFDNAITNGVTIVAAAGNEKTDCKYVFPANITDVITVSACNSAGEFAESYSNYGSKIDLCAPGTSVYSTYYNDTYKYLSGTSMACPHVVAAAALLKTYDPEFTPEEIDAQLKNSAVYTEASGYTEFNIYYGYGLLNLNALTAEFSTLYPPTSTESGSSYGLPQLISADLTDNYISLDISNTDEALSDGATVYAVGYNSDDVPVAFRLFDIYDEYSGGFELSEDDSIEYAKIYVWDPVGFLIPLSKAYKTN